jgi:hypothetical protein
VVEFRVDPQWKAVAAAKSRAGRAVRFKPDLIERAGYGVACKVSWGRTHVGHLDEFFASGQPTQRVLRAGLRRLGSKQPLESNRDTTKCSRMKSLTVISIHDTTLLPGGIEIRASGRRR